jgi:hypothetical protein
MLRNFLILLGFFGFCTPVFSQSSLYSISMKKAGSFYFLEASLKFRDKVVEAYFLFDTGSEGMVLSKEAADKLGYSGEGFFSVEISSKKTNGINAIVDDGPALSEYAALGSAFFGGKVFGGRLGLYPVFRNNYIIVDFKKSNIEVFSTGSNKEGSAMSNQIMVESKMAGNLFYLDASFKGKPGNFFTVSSSLTGSSLLSSAGAKKIKAKKNTPVNLSMGSENIAVLFKPAPNEFLFNVKEAKTMGFKISGVLSLDVMEKYQWHFDCMNRKVGIKSN